jgi:IPT/TIG domain
MKSRASEQKLLVGLATLLAVAVPLLTTGCGGGIVTPLDAGTSQQSTPKIISIVPDSASPSGGAIVIINGSNFTSGTQQSSPSVSFGGVAATNVRIVSPLQISATVPPHTSGSVSVEVTTADGMSSSVPTAFTYTNSPPTVSSVSPKTGDAAGGTAVAIAGANFASGATVSFGGSPASNVSFVNSNQLKATTPAHAAGAVNVLVTNPDGASAVLAGGFTFSASSLTINSVSPNSGGTAGGTVVAIAGANFASGATVSFGGSSASNVSFVNSTQLKATTPAHAAGAVNVAVTNPDGASATLAGGFTFATVSLTVSNVSPNSGDTAGGTVVAIAGANFASGATVSFGGSSASNVSFVNSTQLKATTPAHAAGAVNVAVTNPDGASATLAGGFTFATVSLTISSVSPISGPAAGGTTVTISGTNFQTGVSVTIGGLAATSVTLSNSSTIVAVTPAHSSGSVDITVTNSNGQSATSASGFAFHSIDLMWSAPSSSPVTIAGYNVYRSNMSAGPFGRVSGSTPLVDTSYIDAAVQGGTTYYYEVKSVDSNGTESAPAGPVPATTSP